MNLPSGISSISGGKNTKMELVIAQKSAADPKLALRMTPPPAVILSASFGSLVPASSNPASRGLANLWGITRY
jgi:hypothetical protein